MLIGSQNASVTSLTRNRELGIVLTNKHGGERAIESASATFDSDFHHASPWRSPRPSPTPKPKPTRCHPRTSSGNCYEPGEYCSDADHGLSGIAGDGTPIVCEDDHGWRWEPR
jgi:phosphatidylserine/phosphatidylglycerophosphate/cardiolipin synthase-like enzyme